MKYNNQQHIDKFNTLFKLEYTNITRLTQARFQLPMDNIRDYVHDAYIAIMKTMEKGKKEYDNLKKDKDYLKYMYYTINCFIYNKTKNQVSIQNDYDLELIKLEPESLNGLDMFYEDALVELEKIINPFDFIIFSAVVLHGYTVNQVNKKTKVPARKILSIIENTKLIIQSNLEIFDKLKKLYITDNDFYQDDYEDNKKRNIINNNNNEEIDE